MHDSSPMDGAQNRPWWAAAGRALRSRQAAPEEFTFDMAPAKQIVRATVEARFTMAQPDLASIEPHGPEGT